MLDELCALTGWTRRHDRRALGQVVHGSAERPKRTRDRVYISDVAGLTRIWAALDGPAGKRLGSVHGRGDRGLGASRGARALTRVRGKLLRISASTIDRLLAPQRRRLQVKGRSGTKPGSILKRQIPIRTFAEWDEARPGFCEVDLVAQDGGSPGRVLPDARPDLRDNGMDRAPCLRNKTQRWVHEALVDIAKTLPFPLRGLDSPRVLPAHLRSDCGPLAMTQNPRTRVLPRLRALGGSLKRRRKRSPGREIFNSWSYSAKRLAGQVAARLPSRSRRPGHSIPGAPANATGAGRGPQPIIQLTQALLDRDLLTILARASVCVTDSGGLQKKDLWMTVPCVTVRTTTEWLKTLWQGVNVLAPPGVRHRCPGHREPPGVGSRLLEPLRRLRSIRAHREGRRGVARI